MKAEEKTMVSGPQKAQATRIVPHLFTMPLSKKPAHMSLSSTLTVPGMCQTIAGYLAARDVANVLAASRDLRRTVEGEEGLWRLLLTRHYGYVDMTTAAPLLGLRARYQVRAKCSRHFLLPRVPPAPSRWEESLASIGQNLATSAKPLLALHVPVAVAV